MNRLLTGSLILVMVAATAAFSQEFKVEQVYGPGMAVLIDTATGEDYTVEEGDEIGGWIITEITSEEVTILSPQDNRPALMTTIPVSDSAEMAGAHPDK